MARKRLKQFRIFRHPTSDLHEAVKHGWSWPGCLFGGFPGYGIWLFIKGLWRRGLIVLAVMVACAVVGELSGSFEREEPTFFSELFGTYEPEDPTFVEILVGIVGLAVSITVGAMGNEWRARYLLGRGYEEVGTEMSETPDGALAVFRDRRKTSHNTYPRHLTAP